MWDFFGKALGFIIQVVPSKARDRAAEASTWAGAGVVGGLVYLWGSENVTMAQHWVIILGLIAIGIFEVVRKENKPNA